MPPTERGSGDPCHGRPCPNRPSRQRSRSTDTTVVARIFYGLHDREIREVTEFYLRLEDAERELADTLHDEPGWRGRFEIVPLAASVIGPRITVDSARFRTNWAPETGKRNGGGPPATSAASP